MAMRFCALAPAPVIAAPPRPPARATAPAKTVASMFCVERASKLSAPPASRFEFRLKACTRPAVFTRSTCSHFVRSLKTCCVSQVHSSRASLVLASPSDGRAMAVPPMYLKTAPALAPEAILMVLPLTICSGFDAVV